MDARRHTGSFVFFLLSVISSVCSSLSAQEVASLVARSDIPVESLCWTEDGSLFAVGEGNAVSIRNAEDGSPFASVPVGSARFSGFAEEGEGRLLFVGLSEGGELSLWNMEGGRAVPANARLDVEQAAREAFAAGAFSRNSDLIAAGMEDGSVRVFFKLRYARQFLLREYREQSGRITALAFSADSRFLASVSEDGSAVFSNAVTGRLLARLPVDASSAAAPVALSSGGVAALVSDGKGVALYELSGGRKLGEIGLDGPVRAVEFLDGGYSLAVQTADGTISFYDTTSLERYGYIPPLAADLKSFSFNEDASYLLEGYGDGSVYKISVADAILQPGEQPVSPLEAAPSLPVSGSETGGKEAVSPLEAVPSLPVSASEPRQTEAPATTVAPQVVYVPVIQVGTAQEGTAGVTAPPVVEGAGATEGPESEEDGGAEMEGKLYKNTVGIYAGVLKLQEPFDVAGRVGLSFKLKTLLPPLYLGAGLDLQVGTCLDAEEFPFQYTLHGDPFDPPLTGGLSLYAPVGVEFGLGGGDLSVFTELHLGGRVMMLWRGSDIGIFRSEPHGTVMAGLYAGLLFHGFMLQAGVDFDPIQRFTPGVMVGYNLGLPGGKVR